eukprot:g1538.t1
MGRGWHRPCSGAQTHLHLLLSCICFSAPQTSHTYYTRALQLGQTSLSAKVSQKFDAGSFLHEYTKVAGGAFEHVNGWSPNSPEYDALYAKWLEPRFAKLQKQVDRQVARGGETQENSNSSPATQHPRTNESSSSSSENQKSSLLVGIKTAAEWRRVRDVHRKSWMADGSCVSNKGVKPGFVTGRFLLSGEPTAALRKEQQEFGDLVFVSKDEFAKKLPLMPGDRTKIFYDQVLGDAAPTYVGKMDCDTYVAPCALLEDMGAAGTPLYYGQMNGLAENLRPETAKDIPQCVPKVEGTTNHEPFMQGGFYALSLDLARWMADQGSYPSRVKSEDQAVGCLMRNAVKYGYAGKRALHPVVWETYDGCDQHWCRAWNPKKGKYLFKHLWYEFAAHIGMIEETSWYLQ